MKTRRWTAVLMAVLLAMAAAHEGLLRTRRK